MVETILYLQAYISYWDEFDSLTFARSRWRKNAIWPTAGQLCAGTASDFASGAMLPLPYEPTLSFIFRSCLLSYMSTLHSDSTHRPNNSTPIHHHPNTSRLQKVSARGFPLLVQGPWDPLCSGYYYTTMLVRVSNISFPHRHCTGIHHISRHYLICWCTVILLAE